MGARGALWAGLLWTTLVASASAAAESQPQGSRQQLKDDLQRLSADEAVPSGGARRHLVQSTLTNWVQGDASNFANHDFGTVSGGLENSAKGTVPPEGSKRPPRHTFASIDTRNASTLQALQSAVCSLHSRRKCRHSRAPHWCVAQ